MHWALFKLNFQLKSQPSQTVLHKEQVTNIYRIGPTDNFVFLCAYMSTTNCLHISALASPCIAWLFIFNFISYLKMFYFVLVALTPYFGLSVQSPKELKEAMSFSPKLGHRTCKVVINSTVLYLWFDSSVRLHYQVIWCYLYHSQVSSICLVIVVRMSNPETSCLFVFYSQGYYEPNGCETQIHLQNLN